MKLYFTEAQVPELAALTRAERRAVRRGAFKMLCTERPSCRSSLLITTWAIVFTSILLAPCISRIVGGGHPTWVAALGAGGLGGFLSLIEQSFATERLRPFFRAYVENHRDEIGRAD